jgi:hypothetical protein
MNCNFCNKEFSSQSNLKYHQKTARYCLDLQGKNNIDFKCKYCEKILSSNFNLNEHYVSCKVKKNKEECEKIQAINSKHRKEIKDLEKKMEEKLKEQKENHEKENTLLREVIAKLEAKLEKFENTITAIASKGHTVTNTNHTENVVINNNYLDLSKENMKQVISEHLTPAVVSMGQVGLARMMYQKFLKGPDGEVKYKTADPSRQTFEYVNKDGETVKDVKAHKLTSAIVEAGNLESKAGESGKKLWIKEDGSVDGHKFELNVMKVTDIINLELDNSKFRSELTALAT